MTGLDVTGGRCGTQLTQPISILTTPVTPTTLVTPVALTTPQSFGDYGHPDAPVLLTANWDVIAVVHIQRNLQNCKATSVQLRCSVRNVYEYRLLSCLAPNIPALICNVNALSFHTMHLRARLTSKTHRDLCDSTV